VIWYNRPAGQLSCVTTVREILHHKRCIKYVIWLSNSNSVASLLQITKNQQEEDLVAGDKCPGDKCPSDKCPGDKCPGDKCPSDKCTT